MAKLTSKQFTTKLKKLIQESTDKEVTKYLAEKLHEMILKRIRNGFGVNDENLPSDETKAVRLKPLSDSYKKMRRGEIFFFTIGKGSNKLVIKGNGKSFKLKNVDREYFSPNKSNLTFTGQLLKALRFTGLKNSVKIYISDTKRKDGMSNKEIAEYVSDNGKKRPFFAITKNEMNNLKRELENKINEIKRRHGL